MRARWQRRWFPALVLSATAFGTCGHEGGGCCDDHTEEDGSQFICDGTEDPMAPGTEVSGTTYTIRLVELVPADLSVQGLDDADGNPSGLNTLVVTLLDDQDAPVEGASFDLIEPFTAKHNHGTPVPAEWTELGGGDYELSSVNFVHRGPWFLNLGISVGGVTDSLQFTFCIRDLGFEDGGAGAM